MFDLLRKVFPFIIIGIVLRGGSGNAQLRCPADNRADALATQFVIGGPSIKMPVGAFLLIRKNGEIGAIHLTKIDSTSTDDLGKSTYESYFPVDSAGSFRSGSVNVIRQTAEPEVKPLAGMIRGFAYQPGPHKARIGKWSFSFVSQTMIYMSPYHRNGDQGYEFAPTSACDVSEIDANDKRLRWFRFDPNAAVTLPLADLVK
jgi:hypothetical protein